MAVLKISDSKLLSEDRYHITQADVPGKSADEMKEFMDYIPRRVIIPKLNEVVDEVSKKADTDSVYNVSETYNKTETDAMLNKKADSEDVYTVEQVNRKLSYKVDGDSDKVILDVAVLPESTDVRYGEIYRCNGRLYTKDVDTGEFMEINKSPDITDKADVINGVYALPKATGDTLGRLYRFKGKLYESIITDSEKFAGDITYSHLDPLWCSYSDVSELKAYLDTQEFDALGDDGEHFSRLFFIVLYGNDEREENVFIKKYSGYADGYIITTDYISGGEWSLTEWVNGQAYIGRFITDATGCSSDSVSVLPYDAMFETLTVKREYGYSPLATDLAVSKMTGYEFVNSITLENDSDTVEITCNTDGEDLSCYKELFVLMSGKFKGTGSTGIRVNNGGNINFYVYNNFSVSADSNSGWWFKIEKIGECYDAVVNDNYSLKRIEYASTFLNGFDIANSIHTLGASSKTTVSGNISCVQSKFDNDSMVKLQSTAIQFAAGTVLKIFGRRM